MRFLMMVKANKDSEAGVLPDEKILSEMGKYNEQLVKAGALLAGEGLQTSSKGARVRYSGNKRTVIDGPFTETKELVAGYAIIQVKSREEAIEWTKRFVEVDAPGRLDRVSDCEIRQIFELEDFPVDPAEKPDGWRQLEERLRDDVR